HAGGAPRQGGQAAAAAAARRPLAWPMAGGPRLAVRALAAGALQGSGLPVARGRRPGAGQGGGSPGGGLPQTVHVGQFGNRLERRADRGTVLRAVPAGGWVPRLEATAGLGGVPGVDEAADRADDAGVVRDLDVVAAGGPGAGGADRASGG